MTGRDVELISQATGLPIAYCRISPAVYTATLVEGCVAEDDARHIAEVFVRMERGLIAATMTTSPPSGAQNLREDCAVRDRRSGSPGSDDRHDAPRTASGPWRPGPMTSPGFWLQPEPPRHPPEVVSRCRYPLGIFTDSPACVSMSR